MGIAMKQDIKRWTAKRKSALVLDIIQGKTTIAEASRAYDLSPAEIESWVITRWRYHFFSIASLRISALMRSSAYIFFSRAFSASSSLRRAIMELSMPPYFARHL